MTHLVEVNTDDLDLGRFGWPHGGIVDDGGRCLNLASLLPMHHGVVGDHIHSATYMDQSKVEHIFGS